MAALRPPVFYASQAGFRRQASLWSVGRLSDALGLLQEAEADCKTGGLPAPTVAARALLRIAGAARSGRAAG
jgi:DNA polymerase-3 subunit delta